MERAHWNSIDDSVASAAQDLCAFIREMPVVKRSVAVRVPFVGMQYTSL